MKRFVSLVLALSMVLALFPCSFAASSLSDIEGSKYEAAVDALMELGVVSGYPDGTYLPDNVLLRSELTKLLVTSYGLDLAAKSSMGVTPFEDVNSVGNHWASGYINVSADYKFVNGYPDGSFKPDNPVSYAEAITMCLRVLGYSNEIESRGTWPTNYIAKAQDLKLMNDISFNSYDDGAKRGDVAILIWNMLRTKMWTVSEESEGDGLVSRPDEYMLNVKFKDFDYRDDVLFDSFDVATDKKSDEPIVKITLTDESKEAKELYSGYSYANNDFYTFVPGEEVEVLVNTEDETILTMVPTGADKLVDGLKDDIDEDYDELSGDAYDYAYARVENKKIADSTLLVATSEYITDVKETSNGVKLNKTTYNDKDYDDALVITGDDRISLKDVEEGDVLSKVDVYYSKVGKTPDVTFFIVGSDTAEGELTRYTVDDEDGKVVVIDGDEYTLYDGAKYVEDPDDENETPKDFNRDAGNAMKGEEVTAILDFLGRVVRIEFDGSIGESESDAKLFVASDVSQEGKTYSIELTDEDGNTEPYEFATTAKGKKWNNINYVLEGRLVMVKFNEDDEVSDIALVSYARSTEDAYGAATEEDPAFPKDLEPLNTFADGEYTFEKITNAKFESKDSKSISISGDSSIVNVKTSTTVISVVKDEQDEDDWDDDTFETTFESGRSALENIDDDVVLAITKDGDTYAKYIVRVDDSVSSDRIVAKIDSLNNKLAKEGETEVVIDGETYTLNSKLESTDRYGVLVYKVQNEEKAKIAYVNSQSVDALKGYVTDATTVTVVDSNDDGEVILGDGTQLIVLGENAGEENEDLYKDTLFVFVSVDPDAANKDVVSDISYYTYDELTDAELFAPGCIIHTEPEDGEDVEIMYVIDAGFDGIEDVSSDEFVAAEGKEEVPFDDDNDGESYSPDELQTNLVVNKDGTVTGTLKEVKDFGAYYGGAGKDESDGAYYAVITVTGPKNGKYKVEKSGVESVTKEDLPLDSNGEDTLIILVAKDGDESVTTKVKITTYKEKAEDDDATTLELDFSGVTLQALAD